jgi:hypothetical protein
MVPAGRLSPNEPPSSLRLDPGMVMRMRANVGACKVQILAYGN